MKFYKLVEINEEEYIEKTGDVEFYKWSQTTTKAKDIYPDDKNVYISTTESMDEISIAREDYYPEYDEDDEYDEEWEDE